MIKKVLPYFIAMAVLTACNNADSTSSSAPAVTNSDAGAAADSSNYTSIEWIGGTFQDMGSIKDGQVIEVTYKFKNVGNTNLIINDVAAGCGCTVPEKPGKPFAPGEEGTIKAKFDGTGRKGINDKYVEVKANTKPNTTHVLTFKVNVTE